MAWHKLKVFFPDKSNLRVEVHDSIEFNDMHKEFCDLKNLDHKEHETSLVMDKNIPIKDYCLEKFNKAVVSEKVRQKKVRVI